MELGEVYNDEGLISYDKLFYFHFRDIPNNMAFRDTDGGAILEELIKTKIIKIKDCFHSRLYLLESNEFVVTEQITIIYNQGVIITNGNNFDYYYGKANEINEDLLKKIASKYSNIANL